jgi:hypothetical protein
LIVPVRSVQPYGSQPEQMNFGAANSAVRS